MTFYNETIYRGDFYTGMTTNEFKFEIHTEDATLAQKLRNLVEKQIEEEHIRYESEGEDEHSY